MVTLLLIPLTEILNGAYLYRFLLEDLIHFLNEFRPKSWLG